MMEFDVVLLPSFAQVDWWRKRAASAVEGGLFAQAVTTFDAWVADLWELHGDGRVIVDGVQREMLMHAAAVAALGEGHAREIAPVAARCVRAASGLDEFDAVVRAVGDGGRVESLSERENDFVRAMARYADLLEERGLVEPGTAALALARKGTAVFPGGARVLMPAAEQLTWVRERFFELCEGVELEIETAAGAGGVGRATEGVDVRFGCPSGALAEPGLIADIVEEHGEDASVIIACADPINMFKRLEGRIGVRRNLRLQATKQFACTDFGRAFLACRQCASDDVWSPAALTDVLLGPFSGVSRKCTLEIDSWMRGDRLVSRGEALQKARLESEAFGLIEQLAGDLQAEDAIGALEQRVLVDSRRSGAWRAEQLAALSLLRRAFEAACSAGVGIAACTASLERASVQVALGGDPGEACESAGSVLVTSQATAAQLEPGSCDVAIVADLTSESYPVADKDDAAATFFSKLGFAPAEPALARARREFSGVLALPCRAVVLVRPLGDANAEETYPAVVLEEFVDAYRHDSSQTKDIDNEYRLPANLQEGLSERGEELLFANTRALAAGSVQEVRARVPEPGIDDLQPGDELLVKKPRLDGEGNVVENACPSPSQIEVYLECPYQWFASRRLGIGELDEGFGPAERGSFAHAVFQEFYQRFQKAGHLKVSEGNLREAREIMGAVVVELEEKQREAEPGDRLVAVSELERRDVDALCAQLVDFLDFEAQLLPTFHPAYFEYDIDVGDGVEFAGRAFKGIVDRIDVDDAGHAVILDYKNSVGDEHEIGGKVEGNAGKVQARIYAQAVKRALGLDVVAAIYVGYGRRRAVAGAYDPRVIEASHLPGVRVEKCACGTIGEPPDPDEPIPDDYSLADLAFDAMLDETEAIAARAIDSMEAGDIEPRPAQAKVCRYCPVLSCPKRGE